MGKISLEKKYRWKFLRLNEAFRNDIDCYKEAEGLWNTVFEQEYLKVYDPMIRKWGLTKFYDYSKEELEEDLFDLQGVLNYHLLDSKSAPGFEKIRNQISDLSNDEYEGRFLNMTFDLISIENKKIFLKEVDRIVQQYGPEMKYRSQENFQIDTLERLIQVYKLMAPHLSPDRTTNGHICQIVGINDESNLRKSFKKAEDIVTQIQWFRFTVR